MNHIIEKQAIQVIMDENRNPLAIIFVNKDRKRIICNTQEADEDEIVNLLTTSQLNYVKTKNKSTKEEDNKKEK